MPPNASIQKLGNVSDNVAQKLDITANYTHKLDITADYTQKLDITTDYTQKLDITADYTQKLNITTYYNQKLDITTDYTQKLDITADYTPRLDITADYPTKLDITTDDYIQNLNNSTDNTIHNLNITADNQFHNLNITAGDCLHNLNITAGDCLHNLNITAGDYLHNLNITAGDYLHNLNITADDYAKTLQITAEDYLEKLNREFAGKVLPAVVVLVVLMGLGAVGNTFVLLVYSRRSKGGTIARFIQALAVFDLLSCCLAIPGEIVDMTSNYTFGSHQLCKVIRTVNLFCTVASGATLVVVAIDRYKRICCPMRPQISPKGAVVILSCCALASMLVSLPTVAIYGARTVPTGHALVNGTDCSISDRFAGTLVPLAYNSLQMFLFLVGAVTLVVLYSLVGRTVYTHARQQQIRRRNLGLSLGRFSHGPTSMFSLCSTNMDNHCRVESHTYTPATKEVTSAKLNMGETKEEAHLTAATASSNVQEKCLTNRGSKDTTGKATGDALITDQCRHSLLSSTKSRLESQGECCYRSCRGSNSIIVTQSTLDVESVIGTAVDVESMIGTTMDVESVIETAVDVESVIGTTMDVEYVIGTAVDVESVIGTAVGVSQGHNSSARINNPQINNSPVGPTINSPCFKVAETGTGMVPPLVRQSEAGAMINVTRGVVCQTVLDVKQEMVSGTLLDVKPGRDTGPGLNVKQEMNAGTGLDVKQETNRELGFKDDDAEKVWDNLKYVPRTRKYETETKVHKDRSTKSSMQEYLQSGQSYTDVKQKTTNNSQTKRDNLQDQYAGTKESERHTQYDNTSIDFLEQKGNSLGIDNFGDTQPLARDFVDENSEVAKALLVTAADGINGIQGEDRKKSRRGRQQSNGKKRTTLMLLLITVVYVLSFLPHLVLMALKALNEDCLRGLGEGWELAENLLIRSYFINSMINPIIYSFFSKHFFRDCRKSAMCHQKQSFDIN